MKLGPALLMQLERCGLSAKLAAEHREIGEGDFVDTRTEIARCWHANDQPQLPAALAALQWLSTEPGTVRTVGEELDLIDPATGEVLVGGKPGAVIDGPDCVLVVSWASTDWHTDAVPGDDLGELAMGLAACGGRPFRVATVQVGDDGAAFVERSNPVEPDKHPALLARIKAAKARPPVACPGDWCGGCRQAAYCEAWVARAKTALTVFSEETGAADITEDTKPTEIQIPQLDLTSELAGQVIMRIRFLENACDLAKKQVQAFVRNGGCCVVAGKEYYPGSRDGRETASVADLKEIAQDNPADPPEVAALKRQVLASIKTGDPYEQFGWRNIKAAPAARRR